MMGSKSVLATPKPHGAACRDRGSRGKRVRSSFFRVKSRYLCETCIRYGSTTLAAAEEDRPLEDEVMEAIQGRISIQHQRALRVLHDRIVSGEYRDAGARGNQ